MDQRIIDLYDEYTHKPLARTEFLRRLALLTGSTAAALAILPLIEVNQAKAMITSANGLFTERISYDGVNGTMQAYVARPEKLQKYPTVIVIHENRGLNAHIEDVTRRVAQAGFLAVAPNALSPLGEQPANEDEARQKFQTLKAEDNQQNFIRAVAYARSRTDCNGNIGCVGFCWGGGMANYLAVEVPELKAAVAFYGMQPKLSEVPRMKAAVQLHYAALDQRINAGMEAYEQALKQNGIRYEQYVYENVNHAFHNDTAPARYDAAAAKLAWERTIRFLKQYVGTV